MITFLLILALIVAVAAVVFALQNTALISVSFLTWQFDQSLALVLLLSLAAGVLIGLLTILPGSIRNRWRASGQRKRMESLEKNLQETQFKLEQAKLEIAALHQKPEPPAATPPPPSVAIPAPPPETEVPSDSTTTN